MAKKSITLNGTVYNVKPELDFYSVVCDLEEEGIDVIGTLNGSTKQIFSTCRALVSVMTGMDKVIAGKRISQHISSGGKLEDVIRLFRGLMIESGFGEADQEEDLNQTED